MSAPATNKLLILNSILLVLILAVVLILNYDDLVRKFTPDPTEFYESVNVDDTEDNYYAKQDSVKVDFEGLKNDTIRLPDGIIEIITTELEGFNWNEEFQKEDLYSIYHETIFAKYFPSNRTPDRKFIVVTFSNHAGNFFHAAAGRISLFEFQEEQQSRTLTRKCIAFGYGNEYGLEPIGCELVRIGSNNRYALIEHTSYSGNGGHDKQSKLVYSFIGEVIKLVFDFTAYEYYFDYPKDIEYTEGYSSIRIPESNKTWFDIETKSEETEWNDKSPGAVKRFVFNGEEYVENNQIETVGSN